MEKQVFSTNGARITVYTGKKHEILPIPHILFAKIYLKGIINLNLKVKTT